MSNFKVQTVLGDVSPSVLGRTLTHEHLSMDFSHFYSEPPKQLSDQFQRLPYTLDMIGYIRQYPYSSPFNLLLNDKDANSAVLNDMLTYKKFGGGTIVENTTEGIKRNVKTYKELSEGSGVHVVAGAGHYVADTQVKSNLQLSSEDMYNQMLKDMTEGCAEAPEIKAGFLGEIGSVWPIRDFERKAIIAAGELQSQLKCGVSFHPHRTPEAPFEIIRLYLEAGGSADKAVMSHLDRTIKDHERLLDFSDLGTYCQFDLFGIEVSHYQLCVSIDMPSDAARMDMVAYLVNEGKEDRVLMSHDIHTKHRLIQYGGHGYSHIINNILPRLKSNKGLSQETIDKITITNPARWLEIKS